MRGSVVKMYEQKRKGYDPLGNIHKSRGLFVNTPNP